MILLIFGQPGSGKTTIANYIYRNRLVSKIKKPVLLDGDRWREVTNNKDYSKEGRMINLKAAYDMAVYLEREGFTPILSFVSPYSYLREYLRQNSNGLVQIYLFYNEERGRSQRFAPDFEIPEGGVLKLNTSHSSVKDCCTKITNFYVEQKNARI